MNVLSKTVGALFYVWWLSLLFLIVPGAVLAQGSLSLSVTPTLFDVSVEPGQAWRSSIRIINPNPFDMTVYVRPVHFAASGERGISAFQPILETETQGATLAEWFAIESEPIVVPMQQIREVPFTVHVPAGASPGGQYAALLVSTQPLSESADVSQIRTTQAVSSLFFMRVEGEVVERGMIRTFRAVDRIVSTPHNEFSLRFQNDGTVHLQPQGVITIYNMWGQKRGEIPVNQRARFGLVLPRSAGNETNIREYSFSWEAAFSLLDIGRYRAEAVLAYGQNQRQSVQATAYFWVIPVTGLLIVLGSIILFIIIAVWLIRRYVRRMLMLAGVDPELSTRSLIQNGDDLDLSRRRVVLRTVQTATRPIAVAGQDIRQRVRAGWGWQMTILPLLRDYWLVVLAVVVAVAGVWSWRLYQSAVLVPERAFEVVLEDVERSETISSEDLALAAVRAGATPLDIALDTTLLSEVNATATLAIVNVSGAPGAAAALASILEQTDLSLQPLRTDLHRVAARTVIVFAAEDTATAQTLSRMLQNALLSPVASTEDLPAEIVIYVGTDILLP